MSKFKLRHAGVCVLLLVISACSNEELATVQGDGSLQHITVTARDFDMDADTRTNFTITSTAAEFTWAENDTVGIFPDKGAQAYFPISSGTGAKSASFNGGGWALKAASTYAAYYPFVGNIYLNRNAVPVNYTGQTQNGDASTAHLGAYDFMAAAPVTPTGSSTTFAFEHLGSLMLLKLTLAKAATVNSVTLQPSEGSFSVEGTVDLMAAKPEIKATKTATSLTLDVKNVSTTETDQTVTLYLMMPPTDLTGKTLEATVEASTGSYTFEIEGKNFEASKAYGIAASTDTEDGDSSTGSEDADFDGLVLTVPEAGWLADKDLSAFNSIKLKGNLNGTDIKVIRSWAAKTERNLLDLSVAHIVSGGGSYYDSYNTTDNEIGDCMFFELKIAKIILPTDVTSIGEWAFRTCESLTSIEIPSSVTYIGPSAFRVCKSLTSIDIPSSVTYIGEYAFSRCSSLTSIEISSGVKSIGRSAFYGCISLTSINIPSSVTSIGVCAFATCTNLTSIDIPSSVTEIGIGTFDNCISLTSIEIPSGVTEIGDWAFRECRSLTSINIPSSVTYIGEEAFLGCSSLTSIDIPSSVTSIGKEALSGCDKLEKLNSYIQVPSTVSLGISDDNNITLYVPEGSKALYMVTSDWNKCKEIVEMEE